MLSVSFLIIGTIVLATCQYLRRKWVQHVAYRVAVREHGCQPAPKYPHKDRNGLDLAMIIAHANKKGGNGHKVYEQFLDRFGDTFEQNIFGEKTLVTRDPANIQHVLGTSSKDFERAAPRQIKFVSTVLLGRGILRNVGAAWKRSRDMIKPIFFRGELADVTIINDHVQQLLGQLPRDGSTVDMQDYLQRMFLDVSGEFLLGESFNSLSPDPPAETKRYLQVWADAINGVSYWRSAPPFVFYLCALPNKYSRSCKALHRFIDVRVRRAIKKVERESSMGGIKTSPQYKEQADPSTRYLFIDEMAKQLKDPQRISGEVQNVFFAARDNVAFATANTLFQCARNPHVWTDLRETALDLGEQPLTFELLRSLKTFRYVYNETLRFQGPPINATRTAMKNSILPTGGGPSGNAPIFVEKGTAVRCDTWSLHHDPKIWGSTANKFDPSRWVGRKPPMWEFIPFAGGPRNCPALNQVYTYWAYTMVRLAQTFQRLENRDSVEEYETILKFTVESRNGVKVGLIPPKETS